jgi:uncharacterized membrane-anchored protein
MPCHVLALRCNCAVSAFALCIAFVSVFFICVVSALCLRCICHPALGASADAAAPGLEQCTPLHVAALNGYAACVRALLAAAADPARASANGSTALHYAAKFGHAACVAEILGAAKRRYRGL